MSRTPPSAEEGRVLHQRLLDQDPTATADICAAYHSVILTRLQARFPRVDPHQWETAAEEALLGYLLKPQSYDPGRSDLASFLCRAARCDLSNLLRGEKRHHEGRLQIHGVEIEEDGGNSSREDDPCEYLIRIEDAAAARARIQRVRGRSSPEEQEVLDLMMDGVRDTQEYVPILRLEAHCRSEQEREVKRAKDRVTKRLLRGGE